MNRDTRRPTPTGSVLAGALMAAILLSDAGASILSPWPAAAEKATAAVLDCLKELSADSYLRFVAGSKPEDLFVKGCALYTGRDYAAALRELDQSIVLKDLDVAHVYRGMTLIALGNPKEAIQAIDMGITVARRAERAASWFSRPRFFKGVALFQTLRLDQAIAEFNEVVMLEPKATAYAARAEAYFTRARAGIFPEEIEQDLRNARSDLEQAMRLGPKDSRLWNLMAELHFMLDEQEKGCAATKRACELGDCRLVKEFTECR